MRSFSLAGFNVGKGLRASMLIRRPEVRGGRGTFAYGDKSVFVLRLHILLFTWLGSRPASSQVNHSDKSRDRWDPTS